MLLTSDLREFIALLNSNEVEYLVVGAFAVGFHGYPRYTGDLDILIRPTPENADKVIRVLSRLGFGNMGISSTDLQKPDHVIQLGINPNRIDILTTISGVTFESGWASRCDADLDGVPVHFIGKEELILNKESTGRARDLGDAEELRKRKSR